LASGYERRMKPIRSRDNPLVKRLKALGASPRDRRTLGQTLLDGPHLVQAALEQSVALTEVVVAEGAVARPEIDHLLVRCQALPVWCLPDRLFAQVSPVDSPSGILAVMALPDSPPLSPLTESLVVLDQIQDSGNLGTILRSAAGAGIGTALLTPGCAQAWSPRVLRAGMGAQFLLNIIEQADPAAALAGYPGALIATRMGSASLPLYGVDLRGPVAWLFGSEGQGLSPEVAALATRNVCIPLAPGVESLNVAAAAAVCLFEQVRQAAEARG
jgi:RNA methyltransferase, TrmH family